MVSLRDPNGNLNVFEYDDNSRLTADINALGGTRRYEYDVEGNRTRLTDRNGRIFHYSYDDLNRQVSEEWLDSNGATVREFSNTFDAASQLLSMSDPASSYAFTYDADGRRLTTSNTGSTGVPAVVFIFAYDASHNLTSRDEIIVSQAGATTSYTYDTNDRMTRITQAGSGVAWKRIDMEYDFENQPVQQTRFADLTGTQSITSTTNAFDKAGRLFLRQHRQNGNLIASYDYTLDAANRITKIESHDGGSNFDYDNRNQLKSAVSTVLPAEAYSYDSNGNRTNPGYDIHVDNRLMTDGTYSYQYDAEGNRTKRTNTANGEVTEYAWDYRNRLTNVNVLSNTGELIKSIEYDYDVADNRIAKRIDADGAGPQAANVIRYVIENGHIALQFDGAGNLMHRYLYGPGVDQVLADEQFQLPGQPGSILWPLTDHQGTVRDLVDSDGTVLNHIQYDSFGRRMTETNAAVDHIFAYTGRELDEETDLMFYRARYYDPTIARFVSQDPSSFSAGDANLYRYVENDPLGSVDPTGLVKKCRCASKAMAKPKPKDKPLLEAVISKFNELVAVAGKLNGNPFAEQYSRDIQQLKQLYPNGYDSGNGRVAPPSTRSDSAGNQGAKEAIDNRNSAQNSFGPSFGTVDKDFKYDPFCYSEKFAWEDDAPVGSSMKNRDGD